MGHVKKSKIVAEGNDAPADGENSHVFVVVVVQHLVKEPPELRLPAAWHSQFLSLVVKMLHVAHTTFNAVELCNVVECFLTLEIPLHSKQVLRRLWQESDD